MRFTPEATLQKYYTSNDAMIFIGETFVDEAVAISYRVTESKIPIYSYNSKYFSRVAQGKVLVNGTITLNYIDDTYMEAILNASENKKNSRNDFLNRYEGTLESTLAADTIDQVIGDTQPLQSQEQRAFKLARLMALDPVGRSTILERLRQRNKEQRINLLNAERTNSIPVKQRSVVETIDTFRNFNDYQPVNIMVTHDSPFQNTNDVTRLLLNVHFMSLESQSSPTAQIQTETYSFIAQKML